jgi:hypothetical protein
MRTAAGRLGAIALIASCLGGTATVTSCTPAQAANVISTIEGYLQYVTTFIQVAEGVWSVISPLLGASVAPTANAQFAKAINDVTDACAALEDALAAAQAANNPSPNLSALVANCVSAVNEVVAAISQYNTPATPSTKSGASLSTLQHMQSVIGSWH